MKSCQKSCKWTSTTPTATGKLKEATSHSSIWTLILMTQNLYQTKKSYKFQSMSLSCHQEGNPRKKTLIYSAIWKLNRLNQREKKKRRRRKSRLMFQWFNSTKRLYQLLTNSGSNSSPTVKSLTTKLWWTSNSASRRYSASLVGPSMGTWRSMLTFSKNGMTSWARSGKNPKPLH